MGENHVTAAARHVALNLVRARLVERAEDWPWSSVRGRLEWRSDALVDAAPLLDRASIGWRRWPAATRAPAGQGDPTRRGLARRYEEIYNSEPLAKFIERGEFSLCSRGGAAGVQAGAGLSCVTRSI